MIQEDYISFETARKLKKKGFLQLVSPWKIGYDKDGNEVDSLSAVAHGGYVRPALSLVQKWLRDEKHVVIDIQPIFFTWKEEIPDHWKLCIYVCPIKNGNTRKPYDDFDEFNTYEEALSAGINKSLDLI